MSLKELEARYEKVKKEEGKEIRADPKKISAVLREIDEGNWVIPEFQRDFVWGYDKFSLLFDSIYRGYTIGNILLWKTGEKLAHKKIGEPETISLKEARNKDYTYILDGQQRTTTLYGVLRKKPLYRLGKKRAKLYRIFFDMEKDEFLSDNQKLEEFKDKSIKDLEREGNLNKFRFIDLSQIFDDKLNFPDNVVKELMGILEEKLSQEKITSKEYLLEKKKLEDRKEPLRKFAEIMKAYEVPQLVERTEDLDKVVTVFERINTQNVKLDIFDIMVAKTYENVEYNNKKSTFNLGKAISKIKYKKELDHLKLSPEFELPEDENLYYNIDPTTLLRMISISYNSKKAIALQKSDIYKLKAQIIQDHIPTIRKVLEQVHRYFKNQLNLNDLDVDYTDNKLLSFLTYIYSRNSYSEVNHQIINNWFWNTLIFNRFPGAQLQRIEADIKEFNKGEERFLQHIKRDRNLSILNEEFPINNFNFINAGYDNQNYLYLGIILLLNSIKPVDFNGKDQINLSEYIGSATKNNKHHIIPYNSDAAKNIREKYKNSKLLEFILNNIANICLISSELNQEIKKKDPRDYFKKWENDKNFYEILESHLIDKKMYEDLKNERYEDFLIKRTTRILQLISDKCKINGEILEFNQNEDNEENGN